MQWVKRSTGRGRQRLLAAALACLGTASVAFGQEAQKPTEPPAPHKTTDEKKPAEHRVFEQVFLNSFDVQVFSVLDDLDGVLGAHVVPAEGVLRVQLGLPKDQGLVVTSVRDGGPADAGGLEKHDVLLTAGGKPLTDAKAFRQQLHELAGKSVAITLLRGGKKLSLDVTPKAGDTFLSSVVFADVDSVWIGVTVAPVDATLRAQLRLPEKRGLVVTKVEVDSPAAKAGILVHDVLLEFGGKSLATIEELNAQIQEVGEKAATMKLLRSGQSQSLQVTPARRGPNHVLWAPSFQTVRLWDATNANVVFPRSINVGGPTNPASPQASTGNAELADLVKEVRKLNERIEALQRRLEAADKTEKQPPKKDKSP
jgi:membrane-associated protease RseP (regulator of RpoE activity)